jgi:phage internal scaffolding protein
MPSTLKAENFTTMKFQTAYNRAKLPGLKCVTPSRTQQSSKSEADINTIVGRVMKTGVLPTITGKPPEFGDFNDVLEYQSALNAVIEARESFNALPAKVRSRFHNDPGALLEFLSKSENQAEAVKLGLATARPTPAESAA